MAFLIAVVFACILAGLGVWALTQFIDDAKIVKIGRAIIVVALVLTLLGFLLNGVPEALQFHHRLWN
jgi:asparagine N-glycosylation enzyme membrane subunit Stt3